MSTPWSGHEIAASPFSGEFDAESPFAAVGTTGESPATSAYQEYERAYGVASTTDLGAATVSLPLAHESPEQSAVRQAIAGTTTELWVPGAERLANPRSAGGTYLDAPWRFVFHTIEGKPSAQGFRMLAAGHANPPHLWAMPSANLLLQTIPLNRSAYALARPGSIQTNRLRAIQVEVWGFAAEMVNATPDVLNWLADRVLAPVARLVPINLNQVRPTGPGEPCYGKNSSCRMTPAEWQAFNGVGGHKDVPDNDHWDPGQLNLGAIAARARASAGGTSYIRRERPLADHDGPGFEGERDDEGPWHFEGQNGHHQMAWMAPSGNGEEGLGPKTWAGFDQLAAPPAPPSTESELVRSALRSGVTDENGLTDLVFFRRYPARNGRPISRDEPNYQALSQEWLSIRDTLVRPILRGPQPTRPAPGQPSPDPGGGTPTGTHDVVPVRGIIVARQIAPQVEALLAASEADGVRLSGDGFRSPTRQIELRKQNCGTSHYDIYEKPSSQCTPMTAKPGTSNHERGLAIDFHGISAPESPGFRWLAANAHRFGLFNLPSEPWHWSVDGK